MRESFWSGYVELHVANGVVPIDIYTDGIHIDVYVEGNIADDLSNDVNDLLSYYGEYFYDSLEDYKIGNSRNVDDIWPTIT